ncbi:MAG: leucine-rich repeat domain-containing protein, partial [Oscillospiraceae bacterium]|nr:leucine-rich repeat domain-containing protein [Oscillospiraceae bacterium]
MRKVKTALILLLVLCLAVSLAPMALAGTPEQASGTCGDNLTWEWNYPVLTISGTGDMEDYSPTLLYGCLTTSAPWNYLLPCATTIIIEDGVTSIGDYAFYDPYYKCPCLTTVTLGDDIASIGDYAFAWCSELTEIEIPDGVISIGDRVFYVCSSLTSVTIPDSVTAIGERAFSSSGLTSVAIPNSITSIGVGVFGGCGDLASVTIPNSVVSIGDSAFSHCSSLTNVTIPDSVTSIGGAAFFYCISLTSITIPNSVTSVGDGAFEYCSSLTNAVIPDSITSISGYAFYDCSNLTNVAIPDSITSIGDYAFSGCRSLTNVTIPDGVASIGNYAFSGCSSLTNVTIPDGVTSIGDSAFEECSNLTNIIIPSSIISISDWIFYNCSNLTSIRLPNDIIFIGWYAFYGCNSLSDVYYGGSEAEWNAIDIDEYNECLTSATIHYNSTGADVDVNIDPDPDTDADTDTDEPGQIALAVSAQTVSGAQVSNNASDNNYTIRSSPMYSAIYENDSGALVRVECVGSAVLVEEWSANGILLSSQNLTCELPLFGGFYSGENYNFLVFGQNNSQEDDSCEVLRVVKYSKDWERLSACSVSGANTYIPFDAGSLRMTETNDCLYLHTCHTMYVSLDGLHHQANMTFVISQEDMTVQQSYYNVMNIAQAGYVSHSFNQFIQTDGTYVYRVDHGDAYPRAVSITKCSASGSITNVSYTYVLEIQGATGDNATGVSVGGFELSSENCLIVGNSVDQSDSSTYTASGQRNIFLAVTDKSLNDTTFVWLTDYADSDNITPYTPQLVKLNNSQFLILWEEYDKTTRTIST